MPTRHFCLRNAQLFLFVSFILLISTARAALPETIVQISAGLEHGLILKTDGSVWAFGSNLHGQLGDETNEDRNSPVKVIEEGVSRIVAGGRYSLALMNDGSLWGTGYNRSGQLGDGSTQSKNRFVKLLDDSVVSVSANNLHTIVLKTDGSVWTTGYNLEGQLGNGTNDSSSSFNKVIDAGVLAVSAGGHHSVVLFEDGTVQSVGRNNQGQLGNGTKISSSEFASVDIGNVVEIVSGFYHSHFIKSDGSLWSAGENGDGQLGDGTRVDRATPVLVVESDVASVSADFNHSLVVLGNGTLLGMGSNLDGQLGLESSSDSLYPSPYPLSGVVLADAGRNFSLILRDDNSMWGSGENTKGQIGSGTNLDRDTPMRAISPVLRGPSFDDWLETFFTEDEIASMGGVPELRDSDGDGLTNYQERAFGLNPNSYASRQWLESELSADMLTVTFYRETSSYIHELITSEDLVRWKLADPVSEESSESSVRYTLEVGNQSYFRIRSTSSELSLSSTSLNPGEFSFIMIGRTLLDSEYMLTSANRFVSDGLEGNWVYTKVNENVGKIIFTYDETGNNTNRYFEELILTFVEPLAGTMSWRAVDPEVEIPGLGGFFDLLED